VEIAKVLWMASGDHLVLYDLCINNAVISLQGFKQYYLEDEQ